MRFCSAQMEPVGSIELPYCKKNNLYISPLGNTCDSCQKGEFPEHNRFVKVLNKQKEDASFNKMSKEDQEKFLDKVRRLLIRSVERGIIKEKQALEIFEKHL